jgi:RNA polymerase primary sigma factor
MESLEKQLLLSPPAVRRRHADGIEALVLSLQPQQQYTYEVAYLRITGFRPSDRRPEACGGAALAADLARLLDRVSGSSPAPVREAPEPVLTQLEFAERYGVALRTVQRWRSRGLIGRKFAFPDGRVRTCFRKEAVELFVRNNRELIARSAQFSRLTEKEKDAILAEARELAQTRGLSRTAAADRISRRTGRAKETIRLLLHREGRESPREAPFERRRGPLRNEEKVRIYQAYRAGKSADALCKRFQRSRPTIYRAINEQRALALLADPSLPEATVSEDVFRDEKAQQEVLSPQEGDGERRIFRLYNYLKHSLGALKARIDPRRYVPSALLDDIEVRTAAAQAIRRGLLEAYVPLVLETARLHAGPIVRLPDLVSEGCLSLLRAADAFDYTRRGRFATFARLFLIKEFARTVPEENYKGSAALRAPGEEERMAALEQIAARLVVADGDWSDATRSLAHARFGLTRTPLGDVLPDAAERLDLSADDAYGVAERLRAAPPTQ